MSRHDHDDEKPAPSEIAAQPPGGFHTTGVEGMFAELAHKHTELVGELRGLFLNNVFFQALVQIDANGQFARNFQLPFAAVAVWNHSTHAVTVAAEGPQAIAPTLGNGTTRINAGRFACVPMTGNQLTIYGTAADLVTLAVYNREQPPNGGDA